MGLEIHLEADLVVIPVKFQEQDDHKSVGHA